MEVVEEDIEGFSSFGLLEDTVRQQEATQEKESVYTGESIEDSLGDDILKFLRITYHHNDYYDHDIYHHNYYFCI